LHQQGRTAQALLLLEDVAALHGQNPEVRLRRAVLAIERANPEDAVVALGQNGPAALGELPDVLGTLGRALDRPDLSASQRHNLEFLAGARVHAELGANLPAMHAGAGGRLGFA